MAVQVLLVEDSRAMRAYVSSILESEGDYDVCEVENGFDALRELARSAFTLIIADINLPDLSAIELARFIRQSKKHVKIPMIVISTDSSEVDQRRALEAGATLFVAKPFTPETLMHAVDQVRQGEKQHV